MPRHRQIEKLVTHMMGSGGGGEGQGGRMTKTCRGLAPLLHGTSAIIIYDVL